MNDARMTALEKRLEAVEARMAAIEKNLDMFTCDECIRAIVQKRLVSMTKTEAAEILGVTRATIYAMIADGRLRETEMGGISAPSLIELSKGPAVKRRGPKKAR